MQEASKWPLWTPGAPKALSDLILYPQKWLQGSLAFLSVKMMTVAPSALSDNQRLTGLPWQKPHSQYLVMRNKPDMLWTRKGC